MELNNVLLVEDLSNWQNTLRWLLEPQGYAVTIAANLGEAMKAVEEKRFSAALIDLRLKEGDSENVDGLKFLDFLMNFYHEDRIHVIMLSGHAEREHTVKALTNPFGMVVNFLFKDSLDEEMLLAEVARSVRSTERDLSNKEGFEARPRLPDSVTQKIRFELHQLNPLADHAFVEHLLGQIAIALIRFRPISKITNLLTRYEAVNGGSRFNFAFWSRKEGIALEVCSCSSGSRDTKPVILAKFNSTFEEVNRLKSGSLETVAYAFPKVRFDQIAQEQRNA